MKDTKTLLPFVTKIEDDGLLQIEEVTVSPEVVDRIYQELGIKKSFRPKQESINSAAKKTMPYIRTMPLSWITQVCRLRGKALHVGIVLWYLGGVSKSSTVKLTPSRLKRFGIHPETGRRALRTLEKAQLVRVERQGHQSPVVTILMSPLDIQEPSRTQQKG
jgi:hypothetical protein